MLYYYTSNKIIVEVISYLRLGYIVLLLVTRAIGPCFFIMQDYFEIITTLTEMEQYS